MKYTKEEKLEWVKQYLSGMPLKYPPGVESTNFKSMVSLWARSYKVHGEAALEHGKHKVFTIDEKIKAINDAKEIGFKEVAVRLGIVGSVILNWNRIYGERSLDGLKSLGKNSGRPKMKKENTQSSQEADTDETPEAKIRRLENELMEARAEIALLKKVKALAEEKKGKDQKA